MWRERHIHIYMCVRGGGDGRSMVDYRTKSRGDYGGIARAWCPVFIALANWSITDSDTAQLGNPRVEPASPRMSLIFPRAIPFHRCFCQPLSLRLGLSLPLSALIRLPFSLLCLFISSLNLIFAPTRKVNV